MFEVCGTVWKEKRFFLFCKRRAADLIFPHSGETDVRFWRNQWGNSIFFSHGSNHSAGTAIILHRFKGTVLETLSSDEGKWVIAVIKQDNATFITCCVYGHNSHTSNKIIMFSHLVDKIRKVNKKYIEAYIILGGDFNECMDDYLDRYPPRLDGGMNNNSIFSLCTDLSLTDAWRFFNLYTKAFTWSNKTLSLRSRIDYFRFLPL